MDIKDLKIKNNINLPFEFINDVNIKSIDFIRNTNLVYYTIISNSNQEQSYHGVIDIKTNKILFNTNETIIEIKPYSKNELFVKTQLSIYKICITGKDNNICVDECPIGKKLILDTEKSNYCGNEEESCEKFNLKPNNICVESCNESIYIIENNKDCGLCKDINENKPYKIINESKCLENKPENSFYIYEKLNILKYCYYTCKTCSGDGENQCISCKDGYEFKDGKCITNKKCYETCNDCEIESTDEKEQKCTSCKDNKLLQEDKGNCINECLNGYYKDDKYCKKCDNSCLTCNNKFDNNSYHCTSCKDNKLLINDTQECKDECDISYYKNKTENKCYKCNSNCKSCSRNSINDNNYCLSCYENSKFKYLINSSEYGFNCVEICPKNTILNEISRQCIYHEIKIQSTDNLFIWGFLIVFILFFFGCCILYILLQCNYPNDDGILIDNINKNLNSVNELSEI